MRAPGDGPLGHGQMILLHPRLSQMDARLVSDSATFTVGAAKEAAEGIREEGG